MHWIFVEQLRPDQIEITDGEAHHLLHVLRIKPQQMLVLFNGRGEIADAIVESTSRRSVFCRVAQRREVPGLPEGWLTVAVSPPKGDRLRWMIEKLTELGVPRITLLGCERTVAEPGETKLEKLRGTAAAACKQSRQAWLPDIQPLTNFSQVLVEAGQLGQKIVLAHPAAGRIHEPTPGGTGRVLLIGPEGGFTDTEVTAALAAGAEQLHWPGSILRTETAAIVFAGRLLISR